MSLTTTHDRDVWITVVWKDENDHKPRHEHMFLEAYADSKKFMGMPHMAFVGKHHPISEIQSFPKFRITTEG